MSDTPLANDDIHNQCLYKIEHIQMNIYNCLYTHEYIVVCVHTNDYIE